MEKCFTPCIFYNEIHSQGKPSIKLTCDYYNGKELRCISEEEKNKCHFRPYSSLRPKYTESEVFIGEENVLDS
jgi:hypothetical protein